MAKVILTSSSFLLREGMKHILCSQNDIHIIGVFSCVADLCARTKPHPEEIIVFAEPMCDLTAEMLSRLNRQCSMLKTIIIAPAEDISARFNEIKLGVRGILAAEDNASSFPDAIRMVDSGRAYVSVTLLDWFSKQMQLKTSSTVHRSLSERESEILTRVAAGKRIGVIGSELDISAKTVSTHKTRLMNKLGVRTVTELVQYALQAGVIDIEFPSPNGDQPA